MKTAIIIPTYNRPQYLSKCLQSLADTYIEPGTLIYITDDASTDGETVRLINEFEKPGCEIKRVLNTVNRGINEQLLDGYNYCFGKGYEFVIVLDSDAIVNNYFYDAMTYMHKMFPGNTVSGFNTLTKNELGNVRHPVQYDGGWYVKKNTCGALCIGNSQESYNTYIFPVLKHLIRIKKTQHFDTTYTQQASKTAPHVVCTVPSVAEHIGIDSTLNHSFNPDVSCDFQSYIELPREREMKVSVNLATYPPREQYCKQIIERLLTYKIIDKIRIYLNEYEQAPEWCKHEKIEYIIGGENLKDTGKFFWAGTKKEEYYFTIDDDIIYSDIYFEKHLNKLKENPNSIITLHGKILKPKPENFRDYFKEFHYAKDIPLDAVVNFPGTGCMVFDNSRHCFKLNLFKYHGMTDLWIAYISQINKIKCIVRAHKNNELRYILKSNETLWNSQASMYEQHKEILNKVDVWKNFTENDKTAKIRVKFVRHFQKFIPGEIVELTPEWIGLLLKRKKIVII